MRTHCSAIEKTEAKSQSKVYAKVKSKKGEKKFGLWAVTKISWAAD